MSRNHVISTHYLASLRDGFATTRCGKSGWRDSGDEFTTAECFIFEAVVDLPKVTCKRCLSLQKGS